MYEAASPDVGTASAGRAALASDASTAGINPAGMVHLERLQLLAGVQAIITDTRFDSSAGTIGTGGDGGNAGGFSLPVHPAMSTRPRKMWL